MFQQYTGSSQSHISWAVDGAQEEVCTDLWLLWINQTGIHTAPNFFMSGVTHHEIDWEQQKKKKNERERENAPPQSIIWLSANRL